MEKIEELTSVGGRLRSALVAAKLRQRAIAAHFGVTEQAVSQWFRNESTPDRDKMFELAKLLCVTAEWIMHGTAPREASQVPSDSVATKVTTPEINIQAMPRDVPILGGASCGEDGLFELNGQIHDHARRPPRLVGVKGIYALWVAGLSMSPWREPGGLVYVHPAQPVKIGDYVVVQLHPDAPDATPAAYIKKLVRRTADFLILHQYNPADDLKLPTKKVKSVHRIMDWDELMGI